MRPGPSYAAAAALGLALVAASGDAGAQCKGRPTDPAGFQGYAYGAAAVKTYATSRLRVHYATTGAHAPNQASTRGDGVPDTVAYAGDSGETALAKYADMGFKAPPSDASCSSNGGDDKMDIYLVAFAGADGTTVSEACTGSSCSSFMLVEATFAGRGYPSIEEGFRTVVAHELFHAVQNAYDTEMDRFWAEGTAQWATKQVFPEILDFERQLPAFFKESSRSLDTAPSGVTAGYLYGSAVWPLFLSLRHGPTTVREIFEGQAGGAKAIAATDAVLATKGSSIAEAYPVFGAWNVATKSLAGTGGYPDAAKYPGVATQALADGAAGITSGLAYFAYRGALDAPSNVSLETDGARNAGLVVPLEAGKPNLDKAQKLPANAEGEVIVIVAGITTKKTDAPFTVRIGAPVSGGGSSSGGSSSGASSGGAGGDDGGGCAAAPAARSGGSGSGLLAGASALVALGLVRRGRRRVRR